MILANERIPEKAWENWWLLDGEKFLQCGPFRWRLNGEFIPNGYEMFSMETICADNYLEVVCRYGDLMAVVRPQQPTKKRKADNEND